MAGTPAFMTVDPTTTKPTYAKAMEIAVRNSVKAHPCSLLDVKKANALSLGWKN